MDSLIQLLKKFLLTSLVLLSPISSYAVIDYQTTETEVIKILGINDFHGQLSSGIIVNNEPVGGAAVLASYLKHAQQGMEDKTVIALMGDLVGASPPVSALLHDEPTILFINSLGNSYCNNNDRMNPMCNIVATLGNHEFDKGQRSLFNLIYGTANPPVDHWYPLSTYPGATYPYISANIVDEKTQQPLFPPYVIKLINNIPVAFIGAIIKTAPEMMYPEHAKGLSFLDEAEAINHYIPEIKAQGAEAIIVLIHEGGQQIPYEGDTMINTEVSGAIKDIIYRLDDGVDVVMAGHTHQFLNSFLPNHQGSPILVTQANSYSSSFAEVTLHINKNTHQVQSKKAQIITTFANKGPGTSPDQPTQQLIQLAEDKVASTVNEYIGTTTSSLVKMPNQDGESNLGNLITDAFRSSMNADIAFYNVHGIRADINKGTISKGSLYATLPFSNTMLLVSVTGQDIYDLLEQQWMGSYENILQVSGITYTYNADKPVGKKIKTILFNQMPLLREQVYTIATTDYLVNGNGIFSVMKRSKLLKVGESEQQSVIQYIKRLPNPFSVEIEGRIKKI